MPTVSSVAEILFLGWLAIATVASVLVMVRWAVQTRFGFRGEQLPFDVDQAFSSAAGALGGIVIGLTLIDATVAAEEILFFGWIVGWTSAGALRLASAEATWRAAIYVGLLPGLLGGLANLAP